MREVSQTEAPLENAFLPEDVERRLEQRIERHIEARIKLSLAESARRRWTLLLTAVTILGVIPAAPVLRRPSRAAWPTAMLALLAATT